jgi:hypothetical protein
MSDLVHPEIEEARRIVDGASQEFGMRHPGGASTGQGP